MKQICARAFAAFGAAAMAVTAALAATSPASAAPAKTPPDLTSCVADLTGRAPMACFATFTEAMRYATGGRLADAPKTAAKALADPAFGARVDAANSAGTRLAAGDIVISVEYDLRDWDDVNGIDLTWTGDRECTTRTTDVDYAISSYAVSAPGWDNRISSFQTFGNCWTKHHENNSFGGAEVGWWSSRAYIGGAMDNRTSSEEWS